MFSMIYSMNELNSHLIGVVLARPIVALYYTAVGLRQVALYTMCFEIIKPLKITLVGYDMS